MAEHPIQGLMNVTMEKIHQMVDSNTIIGKPIITEDGTTILPVSKVSFGFAGGGADFATKNQPQNKDNAFGGGSGAAVTITPISFLIVKQDSVRILPVAEPASTSVDRIIELVPEVVDKISSMIKEKKDAKDADPDTEI